MAYDTITERWRYHGTRPFSLRLEGCPPGSVAILFTGTPASDTNLLALDDPAMAQTIAIELRNSDRSRLALGAASPTEEVDANGNVTLNFLPIIER